MTVSMPAAMAAKMALVQQEAAISMLRQNAKAEQQIVGLLESALQNVPVSSSRGANVNTSA